MKIREFAKIAVNDPLNVTVQIRDYKTSEIYRLGKGQQLRSKKHNLQAIAWDIIGGATVLTRSGRVLNLTEREAKAIISGKASVA